MTLLTHFSGIRDGQHFCHGGEREGDGFSRHTVRPVHGPQGTSPHHREISMHDTGIQKRSVSKTRIDNNKQEY